MRLQWFCHNIYAHSGYSDEARVFIHGLREQGVEVSVLGVKKKPNRKEYSIKKEIDPAIPVVYHTYRHTTPVSAHPLYTIARTMLEVSRIPQAWVHRLNRLNEVWVPGGFNYRTFLDSGVKKEKLYVIPSPVDLSPARSSREFPFVNRKKFRFLSIFDYNARFRKGLDILLHAYCQAFSPRDDVCLVIKTKAHRTKVEKEYGLRENHPEIEIVDRVLDRESMLNLYGECHCLVLPSRGEGVGRPLLDAMRAGVPIITTGWGGQRDFLNDRNAFLIDYRLTDVAERYYLKYPGFYGARWAEPDIEDLKRVMMKIYKQPQVSRSRVEQAEKDVQRFDSKDISRLVMERLKHPLGTGRCPLEPPHLFERLYPLYYPEIGAAEDVVCRNRRDFMTPVRKAVLIGSGYHLRKAKNFLGRRLAVEVGLPRPDDERVDIAVIAGSVRGLEERFYEVRHRLGNLPVYLFG